ncbi:methyltransferase family protein [Rhodopirellula sp. MGV]|uniref:methyltransferase family protein n=1 Tax=Rhodopirellula sp. MGV TaxID=2023130 RepID=UPI000B95DF99|nr:isoprenylcysteine carboxylmethyltransferase family protein [Rhodopirellula sp. MGV]OYP34156.1 protein-S-isoprenylcysteine methyltransferase [Rhodopirellula sp. MGV]PNY33592.1 isoprenylcysteine carboxylmethyltransferase family protein [Rhodopirellula baltica]
MNSRKVVASYFAIQALGVIAWWLVLLMAPWSVFWFWPSQWPAISLYVFSVADLLLIVIGSAVAAIGVWRRSGWARQAVWIVTAVCWYPTLVCLTASVATGEAWKAAAMMVCMSGLSLAMATAIGNRDTGPAAFRVATMSHRQALIATCFQILIFWGTFLWVLPMAIVELQAELEWPRFSHSYQTSLSAVLFVLASCLGIWCGWSMVSRGGGTPLPTASAPELVVSGPYRYVRNPMAVAGILQGCAMGWLLGSLPVIAYSLIGVFVWHVFVRPAEEDDLAERFGDQYTRYRDQVGVWVPRRLPSGSTSPKL